jgi:hypothetical protein
MADGRWGTFFATAPIEGPSLLLRAPFALAPACGAPATWRSTAPSRCPACSPARCSPSCSWPCATAPGPRRVDVGRAAARRGAPRHLGGARDGPPEEVVGGALCVAALLAALHDRPWPAGVLLGLAVGNKAWAVLAIGPVALALPRRGLVAVRGRSRWRAPSRPPSSRRSSCSASTRPRHRRGAHLRRLPAVAGVVDAGPPRRGRARLLRRGEGGLPHAAGLDRPPDAPAHRRPRRAGDARLVAAGARARPRPAAPARPAAARALRAGRREQPLLPPALRAGPAGLGGGARPGRPCARSPPSPRCTSRSRSRRCT